MTGDWVVVGIATEPLNQDGLIVRNDSEARVKQRERNWPESNGEPKDFGAEAVLAIFFCSVATEWGRGWNLVA